MKDQHQFSASTTALFESVTTRHLLVAGGLGIQSLLVAYVLLDPTYVTLRAIRVVLGVVSVTALPGLFALGALGVDFDRAESAVYTVVTSLGLVMLFGVGLNQAYHSVAELPPPFTEVRLVVATSALVVVLAGVFLYSGHDPAMPSLGADGLDKVHVLGGLVVLTAALGALFINKFGRNAVALFAVVLIAAFTVVVLVRGRERSSLAGAWLAALALLALGSLIDANLFQGDGVYEFYYSNLVMHRGFWLVDFETTFNSIPRVTLLHPTYALLTGLDLYWAYKLIHPLLFSLVVVALYLTYTRQFSVRVSLGAVLLYAFSYPFFTRLARDTRSAGALLFLAVLVLVLFDESLTPKTRWSLAGVSTFGLVVSHYGVAVLFIFAMFVAAAAYVVSARLASVSAPVGPRGFAALTVGATVLYLLWYGYAAGGYVTEFVFAEVYYGIIGNVGNVFSDTSYAQYAVTLPTVSFTYLFVKYQNIAVVLLSGVGLALATLSSYPLFGVVRERVRFREFVTARPDVLFISLAVGGVFLFVGTVAPTRTMGAKRMYMLAMIPLIPFVLFAVDTALGALGRWRRHVLAVGLVVVLLVNSGLVAAALDERSTQPNLDRADTLEHGSQREVSHLLHRWRPEAEYATSAMLVEYRGSCPVFGSSDVSQEPVTYFAYTGYDGTRPPGIDYRDHELLGRNGYLYLSYYSERYREVFGESGYAPSSAPSVATYDDLNVSGMNRVIDSGAGAVAQYGACL